MRTKDTIAITKRFRAVVDEIVEKNKQTGNGAQSIAAFAESVGETAANFSKFNTHNKNVTLKTLYKSCKKYRINPTWVLLGEGLKYLK